MNNIYLYDGTFDSLISLIATLLKENIKPIDIKSEIDYIPNIIDIPVYLKQDDLCNSKLIYDNVSYLVIHRIYYVYLSNDIKKELIIYFFLKNALIYKENIFYRRNLNCVNHVINISHKVGNEIHKLKGFLRFKKMSNNFYYALVSPTNNVIHILAYHFKKRLPKEYFLIKDTKRNIYAFYNLKEIIILNNEDIKKLNLSISDDEKYFEDMWKTFFNTIAIKERTNLRCQMNFMPKKYWQYMIEMENKL